MADETTSTASSMADNITSTASNTADPVQQNCHLLKLPTELRLMIYEFAFDDIVTDAVSRRQLYASENWPSVSMAPHLTFVGVLGLLHVSRELRREIPDALLVSTKAYKTICYDQYKVTYVAYIAYSQAETRINSWDKKKYLRKLDLRRLDFREAKYRFHRMDFMCDAIDRVARDAALAAFHEFVRFHFLQKSMT